MSKPFTLEDLKAMNASIKATNELLPAVSSVSYSTQVKYEIAWRFFRLYFEERRAKRNNLDKIPGRPQQADDVLDPEAPDIDYATLESYAEWIAKNARCDGPMKYSALKGHVDSFFAYYERTRSKSLPVEIKQGVRHHMSGSMVDEGRLDLEKRPRRFTDPQGYRDLAVAIMSRRVSTKHFRNRIQTLFAMAALQQLGVRIDSLIRTNKHDPKNLWAIYRHFSIHLTRDDTRGENLVTLEFRPPQDKTGALEQAELMLIPSDDKYQCPVFLFLCLASLDGALPCTLDALYEPKTIPRGQLDCQLEMRPECLDLPVFVAIMPLLADGTREPMLKHQFAQTLQLASLACGFEFHVTPHSFRRMVAIFSRIRGSTYADIQLRMAHRLGSTVTRLYMKMIQSIDISSSVWGGDEADDKRVLERISLHPDCLRSRKGAPFALSCADRRRIYEDEVVSARVDEAARLRNEAFDKYVTRDKFPPDVVAQLDKAWYEMYESYSAEYRMRLGELLEQFNIDSCQINDEVDEQGRPILNSLDNIPVNGREVDWDAEGLEIYLSSTRLNDTDDLITAAQDQAGIEDAGETQDPLSLTLTDEDLNANIDGDPDELEEVKATRSQIDLVNQHLFGGRPDNIPRAIEDVISMPAHMSHLFGVRPGHEIINGKCPGCRRPIEEAVRLDNEAPAPDGRKKKTVIIAKNISSSERNHVEACLRDASLLNIEKELLDRFPAYLTKDPMKTKGRNKKVPLVDGRLSIHKVASFIASRTSKSQRQTLECSHCQCSTQSGDLFKAHLLQHDIWIPADPGARYEHREEIIAYDNGKGEWSSWTACFPLPVWYDDSESYHPDPTELESYCEDYFQRRIVQPVEGVEGFGLREDIDKPDDQLIEDDNGLPSDSRYIRIAHAKGHIEQQGLNIFAVWNTNLRWSQRMKPSPKLSRDFESELLSSLRGHLNAIDIKENELQKKGMSLYSTSSGSDATGSSNKSHGVADEPAISSSGTKTSKKAILRTKSKRSSKSNGLSYDSENDPEDSLREEDPDEQAQDDEEAEDEEDEDSEDEDEDEEVDYDNLDRSEDQDDQGEDEDENEVDDDAEDVPDEEDECQSGPSKTLPSRSKSKAKSVVEPTRTSTRLKKRKIDTVDLASEDEPSVIASRKPRPGIDFTVIKSRRNAAKRSRSLFTSTLSPTSRQEPRVVEGLDGQLYEVDTVRDEHIDPELAALDPPQMARPGSSRIADAVIAPHARIDLAHTSAAVDDPHNQAGPSRAHPANDDVPEVVDETQPIKSTTQKKRIYRPRLSKSALKDDGKVGRSKKVASASLLDITPLSKVAISKLPDPSIIILNDRLTCPDPTCQRAGRFFTSQLEFANHLVMVHECSFFESGIHGRGVTIDRVGFKDQRELDLLKAYGRR